MPSPLAMAEKKLRRERARLLRWEHSLRLWEAKLEATHDYVAVTLARAEAARLRKHRSLQARIMAAATKALRAGKIPSFLVGNPQRPEQEWR
jgi:hypothetical protein